MPTKLLFATLFSLSIVQPTTPVAAQLLGPEIPLTQPVPSPWPVAFRSDQQVASDGESYLTVWRDGRSFGLTDLYATRIAATGEVMNHSGVRLAHGVGAPQVVWNGRYYLVFFVRGCAEILLLRLTREGEVIDSEPRSVAAWTERCTRDLAVATNGSESLLVVESPTGLRGILLDSDGRLLRTIALTSAAGDPPAAASDGRDFMVVVSERNPVRRFRSIRLDATGEPLDDAVVADIAGLRNHWATLAWNGERYLLTVQNEHSITARFLDATGSPSTDIVELVPNQPEAETISSSKLIWNGESFVLIYVQRQYFEWRLQALVFADTTSTVMPVRITEFTSPLSVALGTAGHGTALMLWASTFSSSHLVAATFTSASLRSSALPHNRDLIGITPPAQFHPEMVRIPGGFAVSWIEMISSDEHAILLLRVSDTGELSTPVRVGTTRGPIATRLAFDGTFLVIWWTVDYQSFEIVRMTPFLEMPISTTQLRLPTRPGFSFKRLATIFAADAKLLVIWTETGDRRSIGYARIVRTTDLVPISSDNVIFEINEEVDWLAPGWNGRNFLLAWIQTHRIHPPGPPFTPPPINPPNRLFGARISPHGAVLDPNPIAIANGSRNHDEPSIASNGNDFMVVWSESPPIPGSSRDIYARRLRANGFVDEEATVVSAAPRNDRLPLARPFGGDYVVGWIAELSYGDYSIHLRHVGPDGSPRSAITNAGVFEGGPNSQRVRFDVSGKTVMLAYSRVADDSANRGTPRAFVRQLLRFSPLRRRPAGIRNDEP
jgi:hypothetical protein